MVKVNFTKLIKKLGEMKQLYQSWSHVLPFPKWESTDHEFRTSQVESGSGAIGS